MTSHQHRLDRLERVAPPPVPEPTDEHRQVIADRLLAAAEAYVASSQPWATYGARAILAEIETRLIGPEQELADLKAEAQRLLDGGDYPPEIRTAAQRRRYIAGVQSSASSVSLLILIIGWVRDDALADIAAGRNVDPPYEPRQDPRSGRWWPQPLAGFSLADLLALTATRNEPAPEPPW